MRLRQRSPGFLSALYESMESIPPETLARLTRPGGCDVNDLIEMILKPVDDSVYDPDDVSPDLVVKSETSSAATDVFSAGRTALCVLLDEGDDIRDVRRRTAPLDLKSCWVIGKSNVLKDASDAGDLRVLEGYDTLCFTPDNRLVTNGAEPTLVSCGSGDVFPVLLSSGVLSEFRKSGGDHFVVVRSKNIDADKLIRLMSSHIAHGAPVTWGVTQRSSGDRREVLCRHLGQDQLVSPDRMLRSFESEEHTWSSDQVAAFNLTFDFSHVVWPWRRKQTLLGNQLVIKYERSLCDVTAKMRTQYVET